MGQTSMQKIRFDRLPALPAANLAISADWPGGTTAAFAAGSNDERGQIVVSVGGGTSGPNPKTVTVTFVEAWEYKGSLSVGPFVVVTRNADTQPSITTRSTTGFTFTQTGVIQLNNPITYNYMVVG